MNITRSNNLANMEKEEIYQSLIEARLFKNYSHEFISSTIEKLNKFKEKNGEDMIIDILFVKYLINSNISEKMLNAVQALSEKGEFNSQYQFAVALFCSVPEFDYIRQKIYGQSWKLCTNDMITIDEIEISKIIAFYVLKKFNKCFNRDLILTNGIFKEIKLKLEDNKNEYNKKYNEISRKYNELMQNPNDFRSFTFWKSYISGEENDKFTFNVEDDPYLFNAAALMCYKNPLIKVNYDVSKLKFPEFITLDMIYLIRYQLAAKKLLNYDPYSIEIKNLCTFVYMLYVNHLSFKEIEKYKDLMSSKSFTILILIYMNYTNEKIPQSILNFIMSQLGYHDSRNILLVYVLNIIYKKFDYVFENNEDHDFLYVATRKTEYKLKELTNARYVFMKRLIAKGIFDAKSNNELIENNKEDFLKFIDNYVKSEKGERKLFAINIYAKYSDDDKMKLELIMYMIDEGKYNDAADSLMHLTPTKEQINTLKDEKHIENIKILLKKISLNMAIDIYYKFNLNDKFDTSTKINIFLRFSLSTSRFDINRKTLLKDSMNLFMKKDLKKTLIRINYVSEKGQDEGGLAKDWFTNVSEEIIKTNAFIPVPNGTSLTFNQNCDSQSMFTFVGKFVALAITNKKIIGLKLASFIWKKFLNEKITLEDMNDYDSEIYQSLKWISENDVNDLMMTFVDTNDEELCENGENIKLTNENKNEFIDLMIEKKLIKPNNEAINNLITGFRSIIDLEIFKVFKSEEIKEFVNGKEEIDIEDWKRNTAHNNSEKFNEFFEIISNWSQENLKKLLKFTTGSPIVPCEGFSYWAKYGRSFRLEFTGKSSQRLPISHTCFNRIDIPIYESKEIFEQKLLYAIECNDFGFA